MKGSELLKKGIEEYGINLSEIQIEQFMKYKNILQEWNKKINLTAITEDDEIIKKHFIDSISVVKSRIINDGVSIIDVGTGAGFPGIPIKIVMPSVKVILLDSLNKRINFLNEVIRELGLNNIETIHGRAEEMARDEKYREKFDVAIARAVANLTVLSEYCIPYVKLGGHFISMKGPSADEEIQQSKNAIGTLGGKLKEIVETKILDEEINHKLIIVEKIKNTDEKYPRKAGQIEKKPLK